MVMTIVGRGRLATNRVTYSDGGPGKFVQYGVSCGCSAGSSQWLLLSALLALRRRRIAPNGLQ